MPKMKRPFEVQFYMSRTGRNPVLEFIRDLPRYEKSKIGHAIDELEWKGSALREPQSKALKSQEGLFELRVSGEHNIYRVLYVHYTGKTFVLLHAFVKKTQKTPSSEIDTAIKRLKDYNKRIKET